MEQRLRDISPPSANVNRDRLMFEAGAAAERATVARRLRGWRAAAGLCAATAAVLALVITLRPPREKIVVVEVPAAKPASEIVVAPPVLPAETTTTPAASPRSASEMFHLRGLALQGKWEDEPHPDDRNAPTITVTPTSLRNIDPKNPDNIFPGDGRM